MVTQEKWNEIEPVCRELGIDKEMADRLRERLVGPSAAAAEATARELEIMKLIGTQSPARLVHDVRNLLNEVSLLRALTEMEKE